ncbi:MAG: iron-containing alcohol dehydrogenase [Chitinophagaceae bacterium]|nr:iron-containing alcohol dehydrogenase [Chitinophagaceae bacterium]
MQKLLQGKNTIYEAAPYLIEAGYETVFLITGKHFQLHKDVNFLKGIHYNHFIKNGVNVTENETNEAFIEFSKEKFQAILAIGGGSVIDLAKSLIFQLEKESKHIPFFAAAPTTAGSGTEATQFAVIYVDNKKTSLVSKVLIPQLVILDPALAYSLSSYQTAVSGMDVLAQAIESYWNKSATAESKISAIHAISIWKEYFIDTVLSPEEERRDKMQYAAYLAGKAINITRTTGPHALSYYLTANHDIPHGHAVALFLPVFFLYNHPQEEVYHLLHVENAIDAAYFVTENLKKAGLATKLSELKIDKHQIIEALLDEVNEERFANNPVSFDREKLKQLILEQL